MKNKMLRTISVLLIFALTTLAIVGCDFLPNDPNGIFPEGYTGGIGIQPGSPSEHWWVETYEEYIDAIELLKSHGSTFAEDIAFACDEDLFDVKYGFTICGNGRQGERIKFGDNPFDRWAYDIKTFAMVFFDDLTIDELVYSNVKFYEGYQIEFGSAYQAIFDESFDKADLTMGDWIKRYEGSKSSQYIREVLYGEETVITIYTTFYISDEEKDTREFKMTDECIDYIISSAKIVDLNK